MQYERWKGIVGEKNMPKTLAEFQDLKYNKRRESEFARLTREHHTVSSISKKGWTDSFKAKAKTAYYSFKEKGVEVSDHGIARFLQRGFAEDQILDLHKKPFNYLQDDGKRIKLFGGIAVIYNSEGTEIVSILNRKSAKEEWHEIKNKNSF